MNEPVADEVRSLLDGHIVLSRKLGASGHYPAIDVLQSASRILTAIIDPEHLAATLRMRALLAKYNEIELLVRIGEYATGSDPLGDDAIARKPGIDGFLKQATSEFSDFQTTRADLFRVVGRG